MTNEERFNRIERALLEQARGIGRVHGSAYEGPALQSIRTDIDAANAAEDRPRRRAALEAELAALGEAA
jgi:hypothetical protein